MSINMRLKKVFCSRDTGELIIKEKELTKMCELTLLTSCNSEQFVIGFSYFDVKGTLESPHTSNVF